MKIIAKREADLSVEDFTDLVRKGRLTKLLSVGDQLTVGYRDKILLLDVIDLNKDGEGRIRVYGKDYEVLGTPENINMANTYLKVKVKAVKGGA